ncbi:metallo-beta-lactamase domain protein [Clostridiales bacterium oral taxon 876 str. F0540]|nr:metallo-beta-lactamase domain protein [Clostridiales bacterium oral taxon 876 str. F0540]
MLLKVLGSGSKGNCYLLQNDKETLMLECGLPYKTILKGLGFNLSNVTWCLITHEHKDHSKAIDELTSYGITAYSSMSTFDTLGIKNHSVKAISAEKLFRIGDFIVLPLEAQHDAAEPLSFLIQHPEFGKLLFITDIYYCKYKFKELDHIMIECNYSMKILQEKELPKGLKSRIVKSHFELENVKDFLKSNDLSQVKNITLIHLSGSNSNAAQFKEEIEKRTGKPVYIADAGLELELL